MTNERPIRILLNVSGLVEHQSSLANTKVVESILERPAPLACLATCTSRIEYGERNISKLSGNTIPYIMSVIKVVVNYVW